MWVKIVHSYSNGSVIRLRTITRTIGIRIVKGGVVQSSIMVNASRYKIYVNDLTTIVLALCIRE